MGDIAHLRKQSIHIFSQNNVIYNNVDQEGKRLSPFCELNGPYLFNVESSSSKCVLCQD